MTLVEWWALTTATSFAITAIAIVAGNVVRDRRAAKRRKPPKMIVLNGGRR